MPENTKKSEHLFREFRKYTAMATDVRIREEQLVQEPTKSNRTALHNAKLDLAEFERQYFLEPEVLNFFDDVINNLLSNKAWKKAKNSTEMVDMARNAYNQTSQDYLSAIEIEEREQLGETVRKKYNVDPNSPFGQGLIDQLQFAAKLDDNDSPSPKELSTLDIILQNPLKSIASKKARSEEESEQKTSEASPSPSRKKAKRSESDPGAKKTRQKYDSPQQKHEAKKGSDKTKAKRSESAPKAVSGSPHKKRPKK